MSDQVIGDHRALRALAVGAEDPLRSAVFWMVTERAHAVGEERGGNRLPLSGVEGASLPRKGHIGVSGCWKNWMFVNAMAGESVHDACERRHACRARWYREALRMRHGARGRRSRGAVEGYVHAEGMCGQGFMLGPGVGALLSRMVRGAPEPEDEPILQELRPDREFAREEALK